MSGLFYCHFFMFSPELLAASGRLFYFMDTLMDSPEAGWHLDKKVNVSHLLTTLTIVASLFIWGSTVEKRLALGEQRQDQLEVQNKENWEEIKDYLKELRQDIKEIRKSL